MKPVVLMVLDGWGCAPPSAGNAILSAPARNFLELKQQHLSTTLQAHGNAVGLMSSQMGDSNVGHLTIGSGRIVHQNFSRIEHAIETHTFALQPVMQTVARKARTQRVHLMGLFSPGGVHSHERHWQAVLQALADAQVPADQVFLHWWLDGRDTAPQSAFASLEYGADMLNHIGIGRVASISGRYWAMDRDNRWDRTYKAYQAMVNGQGERAASAVEALQAAYARGETDEFVLPTVLVDAQDQPVARIAAEDMVLVMNFRADRVRQITQALTDPDFSFFPRSFTHVEWLGGLTAYDASRPLPAVFEPETVHNALPEWLSRQGLTQLHVAETEKYAHVTFFFNGGKEETVE
ncbi:MAG: 2,3-bisphosphoglycerate-independent phosphoglycerate mutase, partial [Firmicutes bacterium]|nr:2,3-bisphosphoglycerate-independent phosphoglycerate mutase [Bacillota bacterium]